jgi:hypothetical protein
MTKRTTLCLVNVSGQAVREVSVTTTSGFEKGNAPSDFLKGGLANNDALCGFVELTGGRAWMTFQVTFDDSTVITFGLDQEDAYDKHVGVVPHEGPSPACVWRTSGGSVDSGSHGTQGIYLRPASAVNNSDWMARLVESKPALRLCDIVMPGSHDAGMYETHDYPLGGGGSWARTQGQNMMQQLIAGSRYFDLRTILDKTDQLVTYHGESGYGAYGAPVADILEDVKLFLKSTLGSGETVVLKFSHGYRNAISATIQAITTHLSGLLHTGTASTNLATQLLSKTKGQVLVVLGDPYNKNINPAEGLWDYHDSDLKPGPITGQGLTVYDHYADDVAYLDMASDQEGKLKNYGGLGQSFLFLLSWTCTGGAAVHDIEVLAGTANPWLPKLLSEQKRKNGKLPNIAYIDFFDEYIGRAVIAANG